MTVDEYLKATKDYTVMNAPETTMLQYNEQSEDILRPWIDPMRLKKIEGVWYKDGQRVIMGSLTAKRKLI